MVTTLWLVYNLPRQMGIFDKSTIAHPFIKSAFPFNRPFFRSYDNYRGSLHPYLSCAITWQFSLHGTKKRSKLFYKFPIDRIIMNPKASSLSSSIHACFFFFYKLGGSFPIQPILTYGNLNSKVLCSPVLSLFVPMSINSILLVDLNCFYFSVTITLSIYRAS